MPEQLPEPWLRGPLAGVPPVLQPVLCALEQAREDLTKFTEGLTTAQTWMRPFGLEPVGFQLRHIAGSVERLLTYLAGNQLDAEQMTALKAEMDPGELIESLMVKTKAALDHAAATIGQIDPAIFSEPRFVGRKRLPTTVIGLAIHVAEHTQRHVGQAISAAKLARRVPAQD
jgi:hypothetical protein